jgi:hypothetical protein
MYASKAYGRFRIIIISIMMAESEISADSNLPALMIIIHVEDRDHCCQRCHVREFDHCAHG